MTTARLFDLVRRSLGIYLGDVFEEAGHDVTSTGTLSIGACTGTLRFARDSFRAAFRAALRSPPLPVNGRIVPPNNDIGRPVDAST